MKVDKYGYDLTFFNGVFMDENIAQEEDEEKPVVAVECLGSENFENMCSEYAKGGYILSSSTSCVLPEAFHFQVKYVAIFVLPEVLGMDIDCDGWDDNVNEGEEWKKGKKEE